MTDERRAPAWRAPWDALDAGLAELRACRDAEELADRACPMALTCCGARWAALGRLRDGVWSPWREAGAAGPGPPPVPRVPTALEDLAVEGAVARSGRAAVRGGTGADAGGGAAPNGTVVVAGVRTAVGVAGLLHVDAGGGADPAIVEAYADALSSMFALLDVRDRVRAQAAVLETLAGDVEDLRQDDPIELVPARGPAVGGRPPAPAGGPAGAARDDLTQRQREVLDLMLAGRSNAQIAEHLLVAVPTVKTHVRAVLRAVGAVNRAEAVARFSRDGSADARGPVRAPA